MSSNVNQRIAVGAAWMIGLRQLDRIIGLISITILARLLLPQDFGLVVYATTFIGILQLFFMFGFETVLIRDQDAERDSYDTAWTLEILKGIALATLMVIGAEPIANFFSEPAVEIVLYYLAVIPLINGFENIGIVDFQKKMEFDKDFKFRFSVRIISTIVTILLALYLRNHWALVYGMMLRAGLSLALSYLMCAYRPWFSLAQVSRVFGFSKWLLVQNLVNGINERLPIIVLGRMFEARFAAIYNMGLELSNLASAEFASPIRRVLFPGVASLVDKPDEMVDTIIRAIGIIAFVGLPATVGIAATAPFLVPFLLGENWLDVVPVIQILAINGISLVMYSNSHVIFYALDKPQLTAYITGFRLLLLAPATLLLIPRFGYIGAAWALSLTNVVVILTEYVVFHRLMPFEPGRVVSALWRSVVGVGLMGYGVHTLVNWLPVALPDHSLFVKLMIAVSAGVAIYTVTTLGLWLISGRPRGAESYILGMVSKRFGRGAVTVG